MIGTLTSILGGLGIFLLAVTMMTDGLKLAAGDGLRAALTRSTRTPLRGLTFGFVITSLVRSSSAVTVATIGFVNAGLLNLTQSLGVVYGANIGTTTTGWLVALVGLDFSIETLALPMIGLGMLARLTGGDRRLGALGEAFAGFGLFFIGIDYLQAAFAGFASQIDVTTIAPSGFRGLMLYVGVGFLMTLVTQSSGAAVTITLTAVSGGVIGLEAGAATVIGTNIGTTSTAVLAALGATANARRVAAAHVIFNTLTGAVALLLLPTLLWLIEVGESVLDLPGGPTAALAGFHTVFNLLGVLMIWPLTRPLACWLEQRFVSRAESLGRPQFIDSTIIGAPALALEAIARELERATTIAGEAIAAVWGPGPIAPVAAAEQRDVLRHLLAAIEPFIARLGENRLSAEESARLAAALRVINYLEDVVTLSRGVAEQSPRVATLRRPPAARHVAIYEATTLAHIAACDPSRATAGPDALDAGFQGLRTQWHELKSQLLDAALQHQVPIDALNPGLEVLRSYLKIAEQMTKVARWLETLRNPPLTTADTDPPAAASDAGATVPENAAAAGGALHATTEPTSAPPLPSIANVPIGTNDPVRGANPAGNPD